jgi:hypothetical protein
MRRMLVTLGLVGWAVFALHAQSGQYQMVADIPIGGEGGWDYLSVDSAAKKLYVSHATKAIVVDIAKNGYSRRHRRPAGPHLHEQRP